MKKILSLILMFCMSVTVFADDTESFNQPRGGLYERAEVTELSLPVKRGLRAAASSENNEENLKKMLNDAMLEHEENISLSSYSVPADGDYFINLLCEIMYENPNIMATTGYSGYRNASYLTSITPHYLFDSKEEDDAARTEIKQGIKYYTDMVNDSMSELEKVFIIHNEFTRINSYATQEYNQYEEKIKNKLSVTFDDEVIFTALGLFRNNRAVCQGNSIALAAIYNELGIETSFCKSKALNHMWNCVKIGGKWYHLDETWNDPDIYIKGTNELADGCIHNYFLLPTSEMTGTVYYDSNGKMHYSNHATEDLWQYVNPEIVCDDASLGENYIFRKDGFYGRTIYSGEYRFNWYSVSGGEADIDKPLAFYSSGIRTPGAITTKMDENDIVYLLFNRNITNNVSVMDANYENNRMNYVKILGSANFAGSSYQPMKFSNYPVGDKIMLWEENTMHPIVEAIYVE